MHCAPDEQSHFTDVIIDLVKENFAPPAAPIAIGGNKATSRAFIAGFGAHWGATDLQNHVNYPTAAVQRFTVLRGVFSITVTDGKTSTTTRRRHGFARRHHTLQRTYYRRGRQALVFTLRALILLGRSLATAMVARRVLA